MDKVSFRIAWPTMLVAGLLFAASAAAAVFLQMSESQTAHLLQNSVNSRTTAQNLETTLENLISMLRRGSTQVADLNEHIHTLVGEAREYCDAEEERVLVNELSASFEKFDQAWRGLQESEQTPTKAALASTLKILESETLPVCRKLRRYENRELERSAREHGRTVRRMAWGLAGVGVVGALAGGLFGYSVARGLRRSIYRLSVRIQDATDRLGKEVPAVTLDGRGDLPELDGQMQGLVQRVESVVRELNQRERELLRAEQLRAVGQLAAGAAHELRNPLTAIKMIIQTHREEAEQRGAPTEDLDVINGEVCRMERCLNSLLDVARPPKPQQLPFDLSSIVDKTFALLGGRARHQHVELTFGRPDSKVIVNADPEQIQQVLVNLCLNALDAMPGGGKLSVELMPSEDLAILSVRDTGPGIEPTMLPRLFEAFVSTKETGLGLGLVVSHRIAEAHGGNLRGANRVEGGAVFELLLPLAAPVSAAKLELEYSAAAGGG